MKLGGVVESVNVSDERGTPKRPVGSRRLVEGFGLEGDAHGGSWHRQVSLLAAESLERMKRTGTPAEAGRFGENITIRGIELVGMEVGERLRVGERVVLEITQVRKHPDDPTGVFYYEEGERLPLDVVFARVVEPGEIEAGNAVEIVGESR
jgi:molybdopterin adenylyltransferase